MAEGDSPTCLRSKTMPNNRLLAIESSAFPGSITLGENGKVAAEYRFTREERTAKFLAPTIQKLLREQGWKLSELDAIAVSIGPGSFTGLRIGVMTAKGISYATGVPLLAVDTFQVVAEQAREHQAMRIHVMMDAQQMGIYAQSFRIDNGDVAPEGDAAVVSWDAWNQHCDKLQGRASDNSERTVVVGEGLRRLSSHSELPRGWIRGTEEESIPQSATVARLGWNLFQRGQFAELWSLQPVYLRPSGAEEVAQAAASGPEPASLAPGQPSPEPR